MRGAGGRPGALVALTAAAAATAALLAGCGADGGSTPDVYTADTVLDAASLLDGRTVTVAARVDEVLAETATVVVGPEPEVRELLVIHEPEYDLRRGAEVTVLGTVLQGFDVREVEEDLGVDYDEALFARFASEPYALAVTVEDASR